MALCGKSEGPNECLPEVKPPEQSEQGIDCDEFDAIKKNCFLAGVSMTLSPLRQLLSLMKEASSFCWVGLGRSM